MGAGVRAVHDPTPATGHAPRPAMGTGVTEVHGPAENLQAELFGAAAQQRPAAEGFTSVAEVAGAAEAARQSMTVQGGAGRGAAGGHVTFDGDALQATSGDLARAACDLGDTASGLMPIAAELELWALTGAPLLGDAAALSETLVAGLLERAADVALTATRLLWVRRRYEVTEWALTGSFTDAVLNTPLGNVNRSFVRELTRTAEDIEVALTRADIDSPEAFRERVRLSALGLIVRGGGPHGSDAVIRGPGLDDLLDGLLQVPVPGPVGAHPGASGAAGPAVGGPRTGGERRSDAAGRTPGTGADAGGAAATSAAGAMTLGQYLRGFAVNLLTAAGRPAERGGAAGAGSNADPATVSALEPAVAAMMLASPATAGVCALYRSGRRLSAAEQPGKKLEGLLRPLVAPRALHPARREVFTGVTPRTAGEHHMTPLTQRPLPAGVQYTGAVPVTVAGTAAALKDAKNIVSGTGGDGEPVENSTVLVQKATGADGRAAYSVVLTGTEKWVDGSGVHDLKGIGHGMTASPGAALTELPQAQRMAVQALQDAGIRPGDTVVLTGHSLGGIDAAGLAANHEFRARYDVAAVTTFGAPVGDFAIPEGTSVMAVEHVDDVVPTLDGVPNPDSGHRSTVRVNTPYEGALDWAGGRTGVAAHDMYVYTVGAQGISAAHHPAVEAHERRLADVIPHGSGVRTESYVYEGREEH
nr:hypothetical protein [Kocuria tytonis]